MVIRNGVAVMMKSRNEIHQQKKVVKFLLS